MKADAMIARVTDLVTGSSALSTPDLSVNIDTLAAIARGLGLKMRKRSYTNEAFDAYEADTGSQDRVRTNLAASASAALLGRWGTAPTVTDSASRLFAEITADIVALLD